MIFSVSNVAGYRCATACKMDNPSLEGLVQLIDQLTPMLEGQGLSNTVEDLQWTKSVIEEHLLKT